METNESQTNNGKTLSGVVVKAAMRDTATVAVQRYVKQPKYKKFIKIVKKYLVHNPGNVAEVGQKVMIRETKPISKNKHFEIVTEE